MTRTIRFQEIKRRACLMLSALAGPFRRRRTEAARADAYAAELRAMTADIRAARQNAAWATYDVNKLTPGFVR